MNSAQNAFKDGLLAVQQSTATATTTYSGELQRHSQTFQTSFGGGLDRHNRAKRARIETTNVMVTDVQVDLRNVQRGLASGLRNVEGFTSRMASEVCHFILSAANCRYNLPPTEYKSGRLSGKAPQNGHNRLECHPADLTITPRSSHSGGHSNWNDTSQTGLGIRRQLGTNPEP